MTPTGVEQRQAAPAPPLADRARELAELVRNAKHPTSGVDSNGRLLPISDEKLKARAERFARTLDEINRTAGESDSAEVWREVYRGIDEARPHRPLFEGKY